MLENAKELSVNLIHCYVCVSSWFMYLEISKESISVTFKVTTAEITDKNKLSEYSLFVDISVYFVTFTTEISHIPVKYSEICYHEGEISVIGYIVIT